MSFEFQLVLTERCNMACTYCYINQKPKDMTPEVFDAHYNNTLPKLMKHYGRHDYHAALFGGEPLLNWKLIEYIVPIFKKDPRCTLIIAMTNGLAFVDDDKWEYFQKNNIAISLSFDGLWNRHSRPLKDGSSSLDLYLQEPLKSRFSGQGGCKVMVSPESIDTLVDNYKWFVEEFNLPSPDFSIVRDNIWTESDIQRFEIEARKLADQMIKYIKSGVRTTIGFFQLYILDLLFGETYGKRPFVCFAGVNGAGFMPDGMVYPCARFGSNDVKPLYDSVNDIEYGSTINIMKSPQISNPRVYNKCKECELSLYCNAGCTYQQLNTDGPNSYYCEPVDGICELLHILYKESMRIVHELKDNELFKQMVKGSIQNVG